LQSIKYKLQDQFIEITVSVEAVNTVYYNCKKIYNLGADWTQSINNLKKNSRKKQKEKCNTVIIRLINPIIWKQDQVLLNMTFEFSQPVNYNVKYNTNNYNYIRI